MLRPIVILEHHFDESNPKYLISHIQSLKTLGYRKLLIEFNSEVSINDLIIQSMNVIHNPNLPEYIRNRSRVFIDMLHTAKCCGIDVQLIDPQKQSSAYQLTQNVQNAKTPEDRERAIAEHELYTELRGNVMSETFLREAKENNGGVLFLCGFAHTYLLKRINEESPPDLSPCYMIISDLNPLLLTNDRSRDSEIWSQMHDPDFRQKFYQTEVALISPAMSFAYVENSLSLSPSQEVEPSYFSESFEKLLNANFSYELDQFGVLSVTAHHKSYEEAKEFSDRLREKVPGLYFQSNVQHTRIPGMNLLEIQQPLAEAIRTKCNA